MLDAILKADLDRIAFVVIVTLCLKAIWDSIFNSKEDEPVSTVDDTELDLKSLNEFIEHLPVPLQNAIASGILSCTIEWVEVTRDEDDYPTIKPRVVLTSTLGLDRLFTEKEIV